MQEKSFDSALISDLKKADVSAFARTTVEDKGVLVRVETVDIYEVTWMRYPRMGLYERYGGPL